MSSNAEQRRSFIPAPYKVFTCPLCGSHTIINMELQPDYDIRKHCCSDRADRFLMGTTLPEDRND